MFSRKGKKLDYNEYKELVEKLNEYNYLYHVLDNPVISDYEYDKLYLSLECFENDNPEKILSYSPSQRIGNTPLSEFSKVNHVYPLLSLENSYNEEELISFFDKTSKIDKKNMGFSLEYKIDGLSVSIIYEKGFLVSASTRGDGYVGEDVTQNVKTIKTVPLKLKEPVNITVRGEVYISKADFKAVNERREKLGEKLFANPRNSAAGALRQLDSKLTAERELKIFVFDSLSKVEGIDSHFKLLEYLKNLGFCVSEVKNIKTKDDLIKQIRAVEKKRIEMAFDIDGMVLKVDDLNLREKMGNRTRSPYWAVAYKFKAERAVTKVLDIECQVGRTGAVTPRAKFEPTYLAGSTISFATLHNEDYIIQKDIRIGDYVEIEKAGDVIPQVYKVLSEKRTGSEKPFIFPDICPVCGKKLFRKNGEAVKRCINPNCPAKDIRSLIHFVSKSGMDIEGFGESIVEQFVEAGFLNDFSDIYALDKYKKNILDLEGFGEKSFNKLILKINESKEKGLSFLLSALGIPSVGKKTAKVLADKFENIDNLAKANITDIAKIEGFGEIMAENIVSYFLSEKNLNLIDKLKESGVKMTEDVKNKKKNKENLMFWQKTFVLTGTLSKYKRSEAISIIENLGGKVTGSVTGKTDFLLAGENAGTKYDKAKELNIKILSETEFENMVEHN